jgi:hypothetical protein
MAWRWQIWWTIKLTPEQGSGVRRESSTASLSALAGPGFAQAEIREWRVLSAAVLARWVAVLLSVPLSRSCTSPNALAARSYPSDRFRGDQCP